MKRDQQSRSGWGGKRPGAGAPFGNMNAVKHGERSKRAFLPLDSNAEQLTPLVALRVRNLMMAGRFIELSRANCKVGTAAWRELMLLDGIMWQHTKRMMILERRQSKRSIDEAMINLRSARKDRREAEALLVAAKKQRRVTASKS